jgi:peptide/nickel transport system substrate-binding protein
MRVPVLFFATALAGAPLLAAKALAQPQSPASLGANRAASGATAPDRFRPGFDPSRDALPEPRRGGRVVVHLEALPRSLNYFLENTSTARRVQAEVHETLVERDYWTTEPRLVLASALVIEDTLMRADGTLLFGEIADAGESWRVTPKSGPPHALAEPVEVPKSATARIERGTVFTFTLREGVKWHDGRPLRVEDFLITLNLSRNEQIECGEKRFEYAHISRGVKLDERRVRFFYDEQYFGALIAFEGLIPLPAHRYDLRDPLNPDFDPGADDAKIARYVNEHPCNRMWIGLGPYRVREFTGEYVEAERFEEYFDPARGGWFDAIRWRYLASAQAYRALLDGELDFSARLTADDYFASSKEPRFQERFYAGFFYTPQMTFIGWNLRRPQLADARARRALALAFDWDEFARTYYRGLAQRVTAEWYDGGLDYDPALAPLPFDLAGAAQLLAEAGWYDRDADGLIDKDGKPFELRLLVQAQNPSGEALGQKYQENLRKLGIALHLEPMDWPALTQRVAARDFDAEFKAWIMPVESNPRQRWHSSTVGEGTANDTSFADPAVDRLIERFEAELDPAARGAIGRELQRRLYDAQAYNYGVKVPNKFAVNRDIRNVRLGPVDPGYRIRDWYFVR